MGQFYRVTDTPSDQQVALKYVTRIWRCPMKRFTLMIDFVFISGALTPFVSGAQERVAPFDRLISPRIVLTDGHQGAVSHRQMCPESNDTCRTYLAYTG